MIHETRALLYLQEWDTSYKSKRENPQQQNKNTVAHYINRIEVPNRDKSTVLKQMCVGKN